MSGASMPGRFVVVEGGDGAGKSTAIGFLADHLRRAGRDVLVTREPGGTQEGLALRVLLLAGHGTAWDARAELLLMMAARIQHLVRVIGPAVQAGQVVLCDRFMGSSIAYQGAGRGLDTALIQHLHDALLPGPVPDLTVLLDADPRLALARSQARLAADPSIDEGRFEAMDLGFHARVRASFLNQAGAGGWRVIDAARSLVEVQADLLALLPKLAGG